MIAFLAYRDALTIWTVFMVIVNSDLINAAPEPKSNPQYPVINTNFI